MKIATQPIASRFGTYVPGEAIDEAAAASVLEAWEAAGLIEDAPAAVETTGDAPKAGKPPKATTPRKPEKATRPAPETRKRFQTKTEPGPQQRLVEQVL